MATGTLPAETRTTTIRLQGMRIDYPEVINFPNANVQLAINQDIFRLVHTLIRRQHKLQNDQFAEMIGSYEMKTNERNILSLTLSNYAYAPHHAHGLTLLKSLTFDTVTGRSYRLKELFKPGSRYVERLSNLIKKQLAVRRMPLLGEFTEIAPNQDYYIADKALVLYFQLYEITPYYVGFPMFPISVYEIEDLIKENGLLARMAVNG